jgi:hypothetical protein
MIDIKKIFLISFVINIILIIIFFILQYQNWIINLEFSYFTSTFVIYLSFISYKNKIDNSLKNYETPENLKDDLDNDNPYDLWEDDEINNQKDFSVNEIQKILKEEKDKSKGNTFINTLKSIPTFVSLYRVFGYIILIIGFLYLLKNEYFIYIPYFTGLSILPIAVIASIFIC